MIQMEADLADRQYDLTNTYNMYVSQKMTLADLMFWPVDEELIIDTSMPVWQIEPVAAESVGLWMRSLSSIHQCLCGRLSRWPRSLS